MGSKRSSSSRRRFIKQSAGLTAAILAGSSSGPINALIMATDQASEKGPWYGYGIDIEKCIGCGHCARACKLENKVPDDPFYFRTWVEHYTITNDHQVIVQSPNGGMNGFEQTDSEADLFKSFFVPKMCNHCYKSPCVQVCPVGATYDSPEGVVLVDDKYCLGCRYCVQACPYGCRYIHPQKKVVDKCTLCYHRIKDGLQPACVEVCPTQARIFGNLRDPEGELVTFIKEHACQFLKPHLNTGSKLYYNALSSEVR